jgi:hypothetical protein
MLGARAPQSDFSLLSSSIIGALGPRAALIGASSSSETVLLYRNYIYD